MSQEIMNVSGVECYEQNGTVYLRLEDVARGLGFTKAEEKNGTGYITVRWQRVFGFLAEIGFDHKWSKDGFIPENVFYRLAMKAKNTAAEDFQAKVADEIIPSIRRHGVYMTPDVIDQVLSDPDTIIRLATQLKEERAKRAALETTVAVQNQQIQELTPKASYYDIVLNCKDAVTTTVVAKDYGWSATRLNRFLHEHRVQYKQGDTWVLYQKYAERGFTNTRTHTYTDGYGEVHSSVQTRWTQKGRLFIYELMGRNGYVPVVEREQEAG